MTQVSGQWDGQLTGDAAIAPYGHNDVGVHKGAGVLYDRAVQGVQFRNDTIRVKKTDDTYETCDLSNLLQVTNPAGLTVRVATGGAIVDGLEAYNTANVDFATTDDTTAIQAPGGGSNFYRVVLRKSWAAQTIRLAVLDVNVVAPAAVTQVDGTTWEISLATVEITSAAVVTVTDTRRYVPEIHTEMVADDAITTAKIDDEAVTAAEIHNRNRKVFITAMYEVLAGGRHANGIPMPDAAISPVIGQWRVPPDFVSDLTITAILIAKANGDLYAQPTFYYGAAGEGDSTHTDTIAYGAVTPGLGLLYEGFTITLDEAAVDDVVKCKFERDATDILDTIVDTVYFLGWFASYTADS